MADTTDKSGAPDQSTAAEGEALSDKDLGQAATDTGESQEGSEASAQTPQPESETEGDQTEGTDDDATSEAEEGDQEESLLTPEEVAKLPPELKASYVSMNKRFQEKMRALNQRAEAPQPSQAAPAAEQPEDRPVFIDRAKLAQAKTPDEIAAVLEEAMQKAADHVAGKKVQQAVAPFEQERAAAQVKSYFEKFPDRAKYRKDMGRLDAKSGGTMSLDQLYYAAAGANIAKTAEARKSTMLRDQARGNSETATGTPGAGQGEGDIFDEIATAGGHTNSLLLP